MLDEPSTILHHEVTYPLLSPCETVADGTTTPSDIIYGNLGDVNFQNLHLSRVITSTSGLIASPTMAPSLGNYTTRIGLEGCPIPTVGNAKSRRRLKNRESQRRFRERKDQLQKALQQQLDHSRTEYEALLCKYTESTTEAALLLQENDSLRSEIKDLRRHRQLMLSVMKSLQGSKPLSEFGDSGMIRQHPTQTEFIAYDIVGMPPRRGESQEKRLIFVGGPALVDRSGPIRSSLLQQAHRQRKSQQRQNAATERELLLRQRRDICACSDKASHPTLPTLGVSGDTRYQPIRPKGYATPDTGQGLLCSVSGKPSASPGQIVPLQAWDVGAGAFDPMIPLDETTSQLKVQEILHFACTSIWPNFRPLTYASKCYQSWVFPCDNKVRLYAVLWAASYHRAVLNLTYGGPTYQAESKEQLILKGLTLKSLRNEVEAFTGSKPLDSIIMCILYLAVNETTDARIYRDPSPFNPPFTCLHALDIYGSRDYHPIHWTIIQNLLARHGGLEALQDHALAWLLSLSDIMRALNTLQRPIYPCLDIHGKRMVLESPLILFRPYASHFALESAGSGFEELLSINPPVHRGIVAAFSQIGQLSLVLQYYTMESFGPEVLDLLGDCRNYVHHNLFSSPDTSSAAEEILQLSDQGPDAIALSREIYLTCRLALFLYATHVTFPLPRSATVRRQLLQQLCHKIEFLAERSTARRLLLWCVSVVLVASDIELEKAIVDLFKMLCYELELTDLNGLLMLVREFALVDKAIDHHYERLDIILTMD
ncbi:hypothetical protein H9L39_15744 [Fusarium oxysporum f. sp. albedinis]|nr:hypothetical protein H9L39_15744 [Fusarium oxysporum f. sp. albedinis]